MDDSITLVRSRADFVALLERWTDVSGASNYFLSNDWAREYLKRWPDDDFFIGMQLSSDALVYFSRGIRSSPLSRRHRSLGFNESSSRELDSVTVEVNGLIGPSTIALSKWSPAILQRLEALGGWDEIRINALSTSDADELAVAASSMGLLTHVYNIRDTYLVDFAWVGRQFNGDYLASRSSNTRQQIRRAVKGIEGQYGKLDITRASSAVEGHAWLDAMAALHRKRWNADGNNNGFANPGFGSFHHSLVDSMIEAGTLDILRVCAGNETVAYLHNFVIDGRVYFNMSGIDYERFEPHRPGTLAHYLAISRYQTQGLQAYDFLAGTNRYKQSLATHQERQTSLVVRRPLLRFRLEAILRRIKRKI